MNTWVLIYLLGCAATTVVMVARSVILWLIRWITKANVLRKNLQKLDAQPKKRSVGFRLLASLGILAMWLVDIALSWIPLPFQLWQTAKLVFEALREALTPAPEKLKELRYPLRNNPNLDREAVWAYLVSVAVSVGESIDTPPEIAAELNRYRKQLPSFTPDLALRQLKRIGVVEPELIAEIRSALEEQGEGEFAEG